MRTYTADAVTNAGKLCAEASGMPQDKAALAAMMAESFINGMNAQARMISTTDSAPDQARG